MEPETELFKASMWAQVSQLTFIYLFNIAITPYCP